MKIFLDTANRDVIKKWINTGLIDGITTNPTHLSKEGSQTKQVLLDICSMLPQGQISIEVIEKNPDSVYRQAHEIAKLASNVVVKIPFAENYLPVIKQLVKENVPLNITLIFSALQGLMVAKLGVSMISPFIGRIDDTGTKGMELIEELVSLKEIYSFESQILAASIRSLTHWKEAALAGADIATLPSTVFEQAMIHPLTQKGIELFDADWRKLDKTELL